MMSIDRKRRFLPPIYNAARVIERPIPSIEPTESDGDSIGETTGSDGASIEQNTIGSEEHLQINVSELIVSSSQIEVKPVIDEEDLVAFDNLFSDDHQTTSPARNAGPPDSNENQQTASSLNDENISSSVLQESFMRSIQFESTRVTSTQADENVVESASVADDIDTNSTNNQNNQTLIDETTTDYESNTDENRNDATFTDEAFNVDDSQNRDKEAQKEQIEVNLREVLLRGQTVVIDDDLEYTSIPDQQLEAIRSTPVYQTKSNDQLCGNKPFKSNVSVMNHVCFTIKCVSRFYLITFSLYRATVIGHL